MVYCKKILILFFVFLLIFASSVFAVRPNVGSDVYIQPTEDMANSQERIYQEQTNIWISVLLTYKDHPLVEQFCDRYFQYYYVYKWYSDTRLVVFCYKNLNEIEAGSYNGGQTSGIYGTINGNKGFTISGDFCYYAYDLADYSLSYEANPTNYPGSYNWSWQLEKLRPYNLTQVVEAIKNKDTNQLENVESQLGLISSNTSTTNNKLEVLRQKAQESINIQKSIEQKQQQQLQTQQQQLETQQQQLQTQQQELEESKKTNEFLNKEASDSDIDISGITENSSDITENGISQVFTTFYNAFTSDSASDLVIPVPFTDKNIVVHSDMLENALSGSVFKPLIVLIKAFYWYLISRFIYLDISKKINKIKSGNIENVENNNIKEDML